MIRLAAHMSIVKVGQGFDLEAIRRMLEKAQMQDPTFIAMNEPKRKVIRHKRMVIYPVEKSMKRSIWVGFGD